MYFTTTNIEVKQMKRVIVTFVLALSLVGCSTPARQTTIPLTSYDADTEYGIEQRDDGFQIAVHYSKYDFWSGKELVSRGCTSQLTAIAWEHSDDVGRKIEPINEQRIHLSIGRNEITGITSCHASTIVRWAQES